MAGRPSKFSQALADRICEELANGKSLRTVCKGKDMPSPLTVRRWLAKDETFRTQYAQAREEQADFHADELIEIADTEPDPNRARVRIDARKWVASKLRPKVYGERVTAEVTGKDGGAIETKSTHDIASGVAFLLRKGVEERKKAKA